MNSINNKIYEIKRRFEERHDSAGNHKIAYGLCNKFGIEIEPDWTPKDCWKALSEIGFEFEEVYDELQDKGTIKNIEPDFDNPDIDINSIVSAKKRILSFGYFKAMKTGEYICADDYIYVKCNANNFYKMKFSGNRAKGKTIKVSVRTVRNNISNCENGKIRTGKVRKPILERIEKSFTNGESIEVGIL